MLIAIFEVESVNLTQWITYNRALFDICLYGATRINEAVTLLRRDMIGLKRVRERFVIRCYNTKGKQETRETEVHPKLREYLEEYQEKGAWNKKPWLFPGRHGREHNK